MTTKTITPFHTANKTDSKPATRLKILTLRKTLLDTAASKLEVSLPSSGDQIQALMTEAMVSLGWKTSASLAKPVTEARIGELLRSLELLAVNADFDKCHAAYAEMLGSRWVNQKEGWDSKENREAWQQSEVGPLAFQRIFKQFDARAAALMHPSNHQWIVCSHARAVLGTRLSQAFFTDNAEVLALMLWRYGATTDVVIQIANTLTSNLGAVLSEIQPSAEVLALIRPKRSHYVLHSENIPALGEWVDQRLRLDGAVEVEKVDPNLYRVAVQDGARDDLIADFRKDAWSFPSHLLVDFKRLATESTLPEDHQTALPWAKLF